MSGDAAEIRVFARLLECFWKWNLEVSEFTNLFTKGYSCLHPVKVAAERLRFEI